MRAQSVFVAECDRCNAEIESTSVETKCPKCGRVIRLEWDKPATIEVKK